MKLSDFLLRLAADPELLERFRGDPAAVAEELGVTGAQLELLREGKLEKLRVEIHAEIYVDDERMAMHWVHSGPIWVSPSGE